VTLSRFDDLLFTTFSEQQVGLEHARRSTRPAGLQQAFLHLQPQLHHICVDAFLHLSDEQMQAWIAAFAQDRHELLIDSLPDLNAVINQECNAQGGAWAAIIAQAARPAPERSPALKQAASPAQPGF